jgi:hypothetical protein
LPAHRRPDRPAAARRRGSRSGGGIYLTGRRRQRDSAIKLQRNLILALGILLLAVVATAGPSVVRGGWAPGDGGERIDLAAIPRDEPSLGLVYQGLEPARTDAPCAGSYQVVTRETCTHGPDLAPPGLKVSRDVAPVTGPAREPAAPRREDGDVPPDSDVIADDRGVALVPDQPVLVPDAAPGDADFVLGAHGVGCAGDGRDGNRVQVVYLYEFGEPSRYTDYLGSFRAWAAGVDAIYDASAAETGGSRHIRYVTTPDCEVDVAEVQVPQNALGTFQSSISALRKLGYNRTDRKYLIFADANRYCGIGTFVNDTRAGRGNRNNAGPSYGRVDAGCWSAQMAAHQLTHNLGAVLAGAPNASAAGHCTDDYDLMCWRDSTATTVRVVCPERGHEQRLDCNHDDYFHTDPRPGSHLDRHWNVAESAFLLTGDGGPVNPAEPAAAATSATSAAATAPAPATRPVPGPSAPGTRPRATSSAAPEAPVATAAEPSASAQAARPGASAGASGGASPGTVAGAPAGVPAGSGDAPAPGTVGQASSVTAAPGAPARAAVPPQDRFVEFRDATSTSVRLSWTAAPIGTRYAVEVDGTVIGSTIATRARLAGLQPDGRYTVRIMLDSGRRAYTPKIEVRTAPAARPADNTWFVLENALTGGSADLYGARTADGTPIVLNRAEGGTQQQWKLTPAGGREYLLFSRVTGKCVVPLGNNPAPGQPLVQATCTPADNAQRWTVLATDHGFSLGTAVGGLVVGAGEQRFGGTRLLVLQEPDGTRHQSWAALPG